MIECKNCGNKFEGNYCNNCGQQYIKQRFTLKKVIINGFTSFLDKFLF